MNSNNNINNINNQIIYTNKAKCLDCNRCVRVCPVKAIKMKDGQAQVQSDRCIACGTCIKECPQKAKNYRNDLERVKELINSEKKVAAIIAPSFATVYEGWKAKKIPSLLRSLGFSFIVEAAFTASDISISTKKFAEEHKNIATLATSCPAFVNYIEKYHQELIQYLAPFCSPMIASGKYIKERFNNNFSSVFISPCIAKKYEAEKKINRQYIHSVLTFEELNEWINENEIDISKLEDSDFDIAPTQKERLFALSGGVYKAANINTDSFSNQFISASGIDEINEVINDLQENNSSILVEPLFCKYGCINGPAISNTLSILEKKRRLSEYALTSNVIENELEKNIDLSTKFSYSELVYIPKFSEDEILNTLEIIGKANPEDRLDCTSCGYPTCKDKAIAVMCGMAEAEMCVPFMRKRAKSETDKILENSPNGIVIINDKYEIIDMNSAFRKMFMCSQSMTGKQISILLDPEPFVKVATGNTELYEITTKNDNYNLTYREIIYALKNEKKYVGIFVNITNMILNKEKLDDMKKQTVIKATELLEHQIDMAQKIAKLLGESTARGEELVENLMQISADNPKNDKLLNSPSNTLNH